MSTYSKSPKQQKTSLFLVISNNTMFAQKFLTFFFFKKGGWHGSIEPIAQFKRALSCIANFQWHTIDEYGTTKQVISFFVLIFFFNLFFYFAQCSYCTYAKSLFSPETANQNRYDYYHGKNKKCDAFSLLPLK